MRVYLRACGGTRAPACVPEPSSGLSPRMRRNRSVVALEDGADGSISAHAEEPNDEADCTEPLRVYLRACGGTPLCVAGGPADRGLSPRMRRNLGDDPAAYRERGSISAHAEEPIAGLGGCRLLRVYLRACGGTSSATAGPGATRGLSPRMRRNHDHPRDDRNDRGSISAHAEEPTNGPAWRRPSWVYLRACGGTPFRCRLEAGA